MVISLVPVIPVFQGKRILVDQPFVRMLMNVSVTLALRIELKYDYIIFFSTNKSLNFV